MLFNVFDTETTGLPVHARGLLSMQPRIVEFAGIVTDGKEILHTTEFVVNPGVAIEAIITEITGFTNEDLKDKPSINEYWDVIADYFSRGEGRIAHNLAFDRGMLTFDGRRHGKDLVDMKYYPGIDICTVEQTFPFYGRRMRLQDLIEEHIGPYVQKHRALDDVLKLHEVCQKIGVYDAFQEVAA